ncbi:MAG TPA: hypothetical protein VLT36_18985 [Candidatus Dormibacteraeota bacterium]|nr:hypothetical protein [Candidatus Dormibacteraeota bacterium]
MGALQLDSLTPNLPFAQLKRAFTPKAVRQIHVAVSDLWPDADDYESCLGKETAEATALYTGTYEPAAIFRAITRHCLYSDTIYLVDPFLDARRVSDEFNPPSRHDNLNPS